MIDSFNFGKYVNRSLSHNDTPYDNTFAEASFKTIKTEFINEHVLPAKMLLILNYLIIRIGFI